METELKLDIAPDDVAILAGSPLLASSPVRERQLRSTYFDTPGQELRKAGFTLRIRSDGDERVQTVKAQGAAAAGLFVRPEWERTVPNDAPVIDADAGPISSLVDRQMLDAHFQVDVTRREYQLTHAEARLELALDSGKLTASTATADLAELELELREGSLSALFDLARTLDTAVPLRLSVLSKSERGFRLAQGKPGAASKAEPVVLDPESDAAEAFATICLACIRHFRLNEAILLSTSNAGGAPLHQARVGLRRLRSAFSLFKPLFVGDLQTDAFTAALRDLAAALGQVRDLDVLIARFPHVRTEALPAAREQAFGAVRARLEAAETRRLMLDLVEWLMLGSWRVTPADAAVVHRAVQPFAADLLDRRRKRLKRRGAHLARLDDHDRHEVRIEAKKLRYAAEFFQSLWTGKKAMRRQQAFLSSIESLQEQLGLLNDRASGSATLQQLGIEVPPESDQGAEEILGRAEDAFEELMEVKRFWR